MRKTTRAAIEADNRLAQKLAKLQSFIDKTQRHIDQKKDELKAEVDALFVHTNNELDMMRGELAAMEAELHGAAPGEMPAEDDKPDTEQSPDPEKEGEPDAKVASIGGRRRH